MPHYTESYNVIPPFYTEPYNHTAAMQQMLCNTAVSSHTHTRTQKRNNVGKCELAQFETNEKAKQPLYQCYTECYTAFHSYLNPTALSCHITLNPTISYSHTPMNPTTLCCHALLSSLTAALSLSGAPALSPAPAGEVSPARPAADAQPPPRAPPVACAPLPDGAGAPAPLDLSCAAASPRGASAPLAAVQTPILYFPHLIFRVPTHFTRRAGPRAHHPKTQELLAQQRFVIRRH